jgi:hypothetical protein
LNQLIVVQEGIQPDDVYGYRVPFFVAWHGYLLVFMD